MVNSYYDLALVNSQPISGAYLNRDIVYLQAALNLLEDFCSESHSYMHSREMAIDGGIVGRMYSVALSESSWWGGTVKTVRDRVDYLRNKLGVAAFNWRYTPTGDDLLHARSRCGIDARQLLEILQAIGRPINLSLGGTATGLGLKRKYSSKSTDGSIDYLDTDLGECHQGTHQRITELEPEIYQHFFIYDSGTYGPSEVVIEDSSTLTEDDSTSTILFYNGSFNCSGNATALGFKGNYAVYGNVSSHTYEGLTDGICYCFPGCGCGYHRWYMNKSDDCSFSDEMDSDIYVGTGIEVNVGTVMIDKGYSSGTTTLDWVELEGHGQWFTITGSDVTSGWGQAGHREYWEYINEQGSGGVFGDPPEGFMRIGHTGWHIEDGTLVVPAEGNVHGDCNIISVCSIEDWEVGFYPAYKDSNVLDTYDEGIDEILEPYDGEVQGHDLTPEVWTVVSSDSKPTNESEFFGGTPGTAGRYVWLIPPYVSALDILNMQIEEQVEWVTTKVESVPTKALSEVSGNDLTASPETIGQYVKFASASYNPADYIYDCDEYLQAYAWAGVQRSANSSKTVSGEFTAALSFEAGGDWLFWANCYIPSGWYNSLKKT